ncbi:hypothetical protein [uncultured Paracoccus sp.]|uniref:hypothetical protein n=1 Tax=uncultured Paracoccus sp. TaxID=189685 RepID=UPI0030DD8B23|tara:strand:- start:2101 stop:2559 length:459 start_codon:yes stop_codon:yes gene_type:complete
MIVTTENQDMLLEAAARKTASTGWAKDAQAVGFVDDRGLIGVAVYQNITEAHADFHLAAMPGRRLTAAVFQILLKLAFHSDHMALDVLWLPIPEKNVKAQVAALKIGCQFEARRRGYSADGTDAILMSLRCENLYHPQVVATPADEGALQGV